VVLELALATAVLTAACSRADEGVDDRLDGSSWEMTSVWDGAEMAAANPTTIVTAVFSDGTITGSDGCNLYRLPYSVHEASISLGEISITGAACEAADVTAQADDFIAALQASRGLTLAGGNLELANAAGALRLRFRPAAELPLIGIAWRLDGYAGSGGSMITPLAGTEISLGFETDGSLAGIAGCNSYSAGYEIVGSDLLIGAIAATEMACLEPPGIMAQESAYLAVLGAVQRFSTSLTSLELLDSDGTLLAAYRFGGRVR
jgi:heat shock protein HslJ